MATNDIIRTFATSLKQTFYSINTITNMKKTFKLIGMCLVAFAMSMNFSACTDEEDNENNNGNGGTPARQAMSTSGRNIKSMNVDGENFTFTYDAQGRVVSCVINYVDDPYSIPYTLAFTYGDNTIEAIYSEEGMVEGRLVYTLTDGLITGLTMYEDEMVVCTDSYRYENGYLVSSTYTDEDGPYTLGFSWSNGNLTQVNDDGYLTTVHYGTQESRDKIELFILTYGISDFITPALSLQGYFGKGSQKRMSQCVSPDMNGDYVINFSYNYDAQGDVSALNLTDSDMYGATSTFTWE